MYGSQGDSGAIIARFRVLGFRDYKGVALK